MFKQIWIWRKRREIYEKINKTGYFYGNNTKITFFSTVKETVLYRAINNYECLDQRSLWDFGPMYIQI
jgi:hypothetical protein